jgi:hypothetical protein
MAYFAIPADIANEFRKEPSDKEGCGAIAFGAAV